ncbi:hypothetical protein RF11_06957 [Thelohanellus kitauei]|uniref:Uncharacterized protein n=1 Tax=Thelohanellus kitauei TaxID=669202 RepID=A0A0C2I9J7_THEKT|nr:hypothetical protein RF11_06957 [Thelohanellus kitauei]
MEKSTFQILFIIITVAAFVCCAILSITAYFPSMFTLVVNFKSVDLAHFGPFTWYHDGPIKSYESVIGSFRFIQGLYITAIALTFVGPLVAIAGYRVKKIRKPAGIFVLGCATFFGFFASSYIVTYFWSLINRKLISLQPIIVALVRKAEYVSLSYPFFTIWSAVFVFSVLGIMVLIHKFDDEIL